MVDNICGVDAIVDGNYWGAKDANSLDSSRVSFGVGS